MENQSLKGRVLWTEVQLSLLVDPQQLERERSQKLLPICGVCSSSWTALSGPQWESSRLYPQRLDVPWWGDSEGGSPPSQRRKGAVGEGDGGGAAICC